MSVTICKSMTWLDRINQAEEAGEFSIQDRRDAYAWNSCAMSERNEFAGHSVDWKIMTKKACQLGAAFHIWVTLDDFAHARDTLQEIQALHKVVK